MAGLGCGSYLVSNNVTTSKTYLHVKLTDSAFHAIEDYRRIRSTSERPKIAFRNNEGEISIPGSRNNGTANFSFSLQSILDPDGPQGSFEFIRQNGDRVLASLGPMLGKLRIQAKDDSYDNARVSMEKANQQNMMKCVKEVKANSDNPYVRRRNNYVKKAKIVPPPHREATAELHSNNRFNSSNSPHRTAHSAPTALAVNPPVNKPRPPPPPSNPNGKICNPDLIKKPLRDRVVQLLAIKNFRKPQLLDRLHTEGVKEKDKRQIMSVLNSVSQVKDNMHQLSKHLWSEVKEEWPFYSDEERESVRRNKPQSLNSSMNDNSHSTLSAPSLSPKISSQGVKRPHEEPIDPTAKRPRSSRFPSMKRKSAVKIESEKFVESKPKSMPPNLKSDSSQLMNGRHHLKEEDRHGTNGAISPGTSSLSNPSTSPINQNSPHRLNGTIHSGNQSPLIPLPNGLTNGHRPHHETNGHARVGGQSTPNLSPDTQGGNEDPAYLRDYTVIVSQDQRSRYKADFNREYKEYQELHLYVENRTKLFTTLDEQLRNETSGSRSYIQIRNQIFQEYEATQVDTDFQRKKRRYNELHEKLNHIKTLVREYDREHS